MNSLIHANIAVLHQLQEMVDLCSAIYCKQPESSHSGIGQHVRHILDHHLAFQHGYSQAQVDYNLRHRQCPVETEPNSATQQIAALIDWFGQTPLRHKPLRVTSEINLSAQQSTQLSSNTERELLYLINHSIHHMAYASLLASQRGTDLPRHIGLAPSTASYERHISTETLNYA